MRPAAVAAGPGRWTLAALIVMAGVLGMIAIWGTAAVMLGRPLGWIAVVTAADLAFLLRLSGAPRGWRLSTMAVGGVVIVSVVSNWLLAAGIIGAQMGLSPLRSAFRLSPDLAWLVLAQANGGLDLLAIAAALILAWLWTRRPVSSLIGH